MPKAQVQFRVRRGGGGVSLPKMIKRVETNTNRVSYNFARNVEAGSKRRVHVITGNLRRSIGRYRVSEGRHIVRVNAYYGIYEEFGTRHRPPHPYFRPAIEAARIQMRADLGRVFKG